MPIAVMIQLLNFPDGGQQVAMGVPGSCYKPCYKQIFRLPADEYCSSSGCHALQVHANQCGVCAFLVLQASCATVFGDSKAHVLGVLQQHRTTQCSFCSTTTQSHVLAVSPMLICVCRRDLLWV